jgi:hypothetical protein
MGLVSILPSTVGAALIELVEIQIWRGPDYGSRGTRWFSEWERPILQQDYIEWSQSEYPAERDQILKRVVSKLRESEDPYWDSPKEGALKLPQWSRSIR